MPSSLIVLRSNEKRIPASWEASDFSLTFDLEVLSE